MILNINTINISTLYKKGASIVFLRVKEHNLLKQDRSMLHLLKQISVNDNFILVGVPVASVYLGFISLIALLYRLNCKILIEPQPTFAAVGCKSCITKVT